jgi:hypothetical protein
MLMHPYPLQPMHKYPHHLVWIFVLAFISAVVLSDAYKVFLLALFLFAVYTSGSHRRKPVCPDCRRRLEERKIPLIEDGRERIYVFYDCHSCKITFDPDVQLDYS